MSRSYKDNLRKAADLIKGAHQVVAFTGAGISVESNIPPFRGPQGIWSKVDPKFADIIFFKKHPLESWRVIKKVFFDPIKDAHPNDAHRCLAKMEQKGLLHGVITQNIDNLHQKAGSKKVIEFHGNTRQLVCVECGAVYEVTDQLLADLPPKCSNCNGILKPDFVFFGESIPYEAIAFSQKSVQDADVWLVIGTSGEIYPASLLPIEAKQHGAWIIEVNIKPSNYTDQITDVFLQGAATKVLKDLCAQLGID